MKGFWPLFKKEIREQLRTYKLVIVGGIFVFFGITTPLLLKFLPDILKLAGEQMTIVIPPPTAAQSLAEYAGTIGQVGILVAVLICMGSVANELRHGTALMILSKPVSRAAFVNAKLAAASVTFLVSLIAASVFCFGYTVLLIEGASVWNFVILNLLLLLFLLFAIALTLLFSSLFKSSLAAGGLSIGIIIAQAVFSAIPVVGDYMPGKVLSWGAGLLAGGTTSYWWALALTVVIIIVCIYLAGYSLRKRDL
jgi:ABC-2 type transport system permease protein